MNFEINPWALIETIEAVCPIKGLRCQRGLEGTKWQELIITPCPKQCEQLDGQTHGPMRIVVEGGKEPVCSCERCGAVPIYDLLRAWGIELDGFPCVSF